MFVEIIMKELGLVLSQRQFKDIMRLADNFDRMKSNSQFRKYKPFVPLKENRKAWYVEMNCTQFERFLNLHFLQFCRIALSVLNCSSQRSSKDHLLLIQCYFKNKRILFNSGGITRYNRY